MFSVQKCVDQSCTHCKPPRLPPDVFQSLHPIPDPVPQGDRYKDFTTLYGTETSEQHRPSITSSLAKSHGMPFPPSAQYAKNVKTVLQCDECSKWRLIYSKSALKVSQKSELESILLDISYVCGNTFSDIETDEDSVLNLVYVRANITCTCPIEIPYFSAGYEPICYYCGSENGLESEQSDCYPLCTACRSSGKKPTTKRTRQLFKSKT